MQKRNNKKAFTLIELIVVIAILTILVLLAVPKYLEYTAKAEEARIKNDTKVVSNLVMQSLTRGDISYKGDIADMSNINTAITKKRAYKEGILLGEGDAIGEELTLIKDGFVKYEARSIQLQISRMVH